MKTARKFSVEVLVYSLAFFLFMVGVGLTIQRFNLDAIAQSPEPKAEVKFKEFDPIIEFTDYVVSLRGEEVLRIEGLGTPGHVAWSNVVIRTTLKPTVEKTTNGWKIKLENP